MGHLVLVVAVKVSHSVGITGVCTKRIKENFVFVLLSFGNVYCSLWYPIFYINVEFTMDAFSLFYGFIPRLLPWHFFHVANLQRFQQAMKNIPWIASYIQPTRYFTAQGQFCSWNDDSMWLLDWCRRFCVMRMPYIYNVWASSFDLGKYDNSVSPPLSYMS